MTPDEEQLVTQAKSIREMLVEINQLKKEKSLLFGAIDRKNIEINHLEEHIHSLHINNDLDTEKNVGY